MSWLNITIPIQLTSIGKTMITRIADVVRLSVGCGIICILVFRKPTVYWSGQIKMREC